MKKSQLIVLVFILSLLAASCATHRPKAAMWVNPLVEGYASASESKGLKASLSEPGGVDKLYRESEERKSDKKVIFSALLNLEISNPDTVNSKIEDIASKYKGYVHKIGTRQSIIRVKSGKLKEAIEEVASLGEVLSKNLTGQDVTDQYLDYQIRLENAEKARKRYLALLDKAETVEAALKVERELERLNETIDLIKGRMNRIGHLSEFATITINLREEVKKPKPGLLGYVGLGLYHSVKWLFVRN